MTVEAEAEAEADRIVRADAQTGIVRCPRCKQSPLGAGFWRFVPRGPGEWDHSCADQPRPAEVDGGPEQPKLVRGVRHSTGAIGCPGCGAQPRHFEPPLQARPSVGWCRHCRCWVEVPPEDDPHPALAVPADAPPSILATILANDRELEERERRVGWLMHALGRAYAACGGQSAGETEAGRWLADQLWRITERVGTAPRPLPRAVAPEVATALTRLIDSGAASPEGRARLDEARARAIEVALVFHANDLFPRGGAESAP